MKILAGVKFEAEINPRRCKFIENRCPQFRQGSKRLRNKYI
jgi:hypothetical protein